MAHGCPARTDGCCARTDEVEVHDTEEEDAQTPGKGHCNSEEAEAANPGKTEFLNTGTSRKGETLKHRKLTTSKLMEKH